MKQRENPTQNKLKGVVMRKDLHAYFMLSLYGKAS